MKAWIARDKIGYLRIYFNTRPFKGLNEWETIDDYNHLDPNLFPSVKWEDEEPTEVEIIIKPKEK